MKIKRRNILTLLLVLFLLIGQAEPALAADTAATMQLSKTEGTVTVTNASARKLAILDNMRLYTGYTVETAASSYAWINLDSSKLVKLDASTKVEIRKSGKKLEVLLKSGNLLADVSQKLDQDETLNVRTSTAIVGIRGTKVQVGTARVNQEAAGSAHAYYSGQAQKTTVTVIEGTVGVTSNSGGASGGGLPVMTTTVLTAGETATVTPVAAPAETAGSSLDVSTTVVTKTTLVAEDLTGSTMEHLTSGGETVVISTADGTVTITPGDAAERIAQDQQEAADQAARNEAQGDQQGQTVESQNTDPVWADTGSGSPSSGGNSSSGGSSGGSPSSGSSSGDSSSDDSSSDDSSSGDSSSDDSSSDDSSPGGSDGTTTPVTYTVMFDSQGGSAVNSAAVEEGQSAARPADPSREGYTFTGWYADTDCTQLWDFSTSITENLTLYAGWELEGAPVLPAPVFTITFVYNDGVTADETMQTVGMMMTSLPEPTRSGYIFDGWFTADNADTPVTTDTVYREDTTLYAKWTEYTMQVIGYTLTQDGANLYMNDAGAANEDLENIRSLLQSKTDIVVKAPEGSDYKLLITDTFEIPEGKTLQMEAGLIVGLNGTYSSDGQDKPGTLTVNGTLVAAGSFEVQMAGDADSGDISKLNIGDISKLNVGENGNFTICGSDTQLLCGDIDNQGEMTIETGCELQLSGGAAFTNTGVVENGGTLTLTQATVSNTWAITNNGIINIQPNCSFNNGDSAASIGGSISNSGTINNSGSINSTGDSNIVNTGTITNIGSSNGNGAIANFGLIMNNSGGTITNTGSSADAVGLILNDSDSVSINGGGSIINNGEILNETYGLITNNYHIDNQSGGTITNDGEITIGLDVIDSDGTIRGYLGNYGTITNSGDINNRDTIWNRENGSIENTNTGTIRIEATGNIDNLTSSSIITNNGNINNGGTIWNEESAVIENTNSGTITNETDGTIANIGTITNRTGGTITNRGTITNNADGIINNETDSTIYNNAAIDNNGTISNNGTIDNGGTIINEERGTITNSGTIFIISSTNASGEVTLGTLTNNGTINNETDSTIYNNGIITNNKTINNKTDGTISSSGTFTNSGEITNDMGGTITSSSGTFTNETGGTINNNGDITNYYEMINRDSATITINNGGTLLNYSGSTITNEAGGTITNNGTFINETDGTITNEGTITNTGTITNDGAYTGSRIIGGGTIEGDNASDMQFNIGDTSGNEGGTP